MRRCFLLFVFVQAACTSVLLDPHDVEQMLLNLVINARDALPMGGQITIDLDVGNHRIRMVVP